MRKIKLAPNVEIALLKRRIAELERFRDEAIKLTSPNVKAVYRAAIRWNRQWWPEVCDCAPSKSEIALHNACDRAAKMANTGRGGRGK